MIPSSVIEAVIDHPGTRRREGDHRLGDQRARIEAHRTAFDQVAAADGDQVGRRPASADEMNGHETVSPEFDFRRDVACRHSRAAYRPSCGPWRPSTRRVVEAPIRTTVSMSTRSADRAPSVRDGDLLTGPSQIPAQHDRRLGRPVRQQDLSRPPQLGRAAARHGVVERHHEIPLPRRGQPLFDHRPGCQQVGEGDRAEIVAQRRPGPEPAAA